MADLEFIDTAGVRALIEVKTRHSARGRRVHLVNSARLVRKVVTLYGRSDLLAG
jgi:ABC-type transporter Mla MlaB component